MPHSNEQYKLYINGRSVQGEATPFSVINPASGAPLAEAPCASAAQVEAAIAAARQAQPHWAALPDHERKACLERAAQVIAEHSAELARLITLEQGKPLAGPGSLFEMNAAVAWTQATANTDLPDEVVYEDSSRKDVMSYRPLGVVASVTPWNWPVMIAIWHIMPALRMGNTVVIKPSEYTPLATLELVRLVGELLPPGVLNVISGDGTVGQILTSHPYVNKVIFTGSESTGRKIIQASAQNMARLTLELGGNDAAVVLDDVDVGAIANDLFWGAFLNAGQTCACIKRLYVPRSRQDEIVDALAGIIAQMTLGDGLEDGTLIGPVQNRMQFDKVIGLVEDARAQGGQIVCGGQAAPRPGYFYPPTLVTGLRDGMRLVDEEQFGPVLPIIAYDDLEQAIASANALNLGLGASVWSSDPEKANRVATRLEAGSIWINQHGVVHPAVPFGGIKASGYGKEFGVEGLKAVCAARVITFKK